MTVGLCAAPAARSANGVSAVDLPPALSAPLSDSAGLAGSAGSVESPFPQASPRLSVDAPQEGARRIGSRSIVGVLVDVDSVAIRVRQERCAKVRNRNVACLKCAEACTSGCIALVDDRLVVDASKCVGCGTCATVCPTCALEARNPSDAQLARSCLSARCGDGVVVVCEQVRQALKGLLDESRAAAVVCAGRIDEALACELAAEGVRRVHVVCGRCDRCDQRHGLDVARMVAESVNDLLGAWGSDARVLVEQEVPAFALFDGADAEDTRAALEARFARHCGNEPLRASGEGSDFFSPSLDVEAPSVSAPASEPSFDAASVLAVESASGSVSAQTPAPAPDFRLRVMEDGTLPHFVPDRRERLLDSLARLGDAPSGTLASRLWGCVVIDGTRCSSCRMCATFCPTGAIRKFDEEDGTFGVLHAPSDCVKCGSCRDVCPEDAIVLRDEVRASFLVEGAAHRYVMRPRAVELGNAQQIVNTLRERMKGTDLFER